MSDLPKESILPGYSIKINDPAFHKYIKNSNQWAVIFSLVLALVAIISFYIYGETSIDMDNPQALFIGLGIGGMFLLIALMQVIGRKNDKNWDGIVINKFIKKKKRRSNMSGGLLYLEYTVYIRSLTGKIHEIRADDDDTLYNYYKIGDKIRHHRGLNSYEKYDKSKDEINFCNACASLNDIQEDYCFRCKCPLLKGGD